MLTFYGLERLIKLSIQKGETPFFINATAGTTVLVKYKEQGFNKHKNEKRRN